MYWCREAGNPFIIISTLQLLRALQWAWRTGGSVSALYRALPNFHLCRCSPSQSLYHVRYSFSCDYTDWSPISVPGEYQLFMVEWIGNLCNLEIEEHDGDVLNYLKAWWGSLLRMRWKNTFTIACSFIFKAISLTATGIRPDNINILYNDKSGNVLGS